MFAKSATPATPVVRSKTHMDDSVVWVNDWYSPQISANTADLKLKGWIKKSSSEKEPSVLVANNEFIDLETAKYYTEPVVEVEVKEEVPQTGSGNADLKLALSMDKKDDQISSLSGLGM